MPDETFIYTGTGGTSEFSVDNDGDLCIHPGGDPTWLTANAASALGRWLLGKFQEKGAGSLCFDMSPNFYIVGCALIAKDPSGDLEVTMGAEKMFFHPVDARRLADWIYETFPEEG